MTMSTLLLVCPAAIVFAVRVVLRKVTRAEGMLAGFFVLHLSLIVLQQYADVGKAIFDPRYHTPSYPLLFGWTAYPLALLVRRFRGMLAPLVLLLIVAVCRVPRARDVHRRGRVEMMALSERAAEVIRRDWKGPKHGPTTLTLGEYRSSRLPVIAAQPTIAYLAQGRQAVGDGRAWWRRSFKKWTDIPDYICLSNEHMLNPDFAKVVKVCESSKYELIDELRSGIAFLRIYRRRTGCHTETL